MRKAIILRCYEDGETVITLQDMADHNKIENIYKKLERESQHKHFDKYEIHYLDQLKNEDNFINPYNI